MMAMYNGGAMYATEKRANVGLAGDTGAKAVTGYSSATDVTTGGANDNFLALGPGASDAAWGEFDPALMLETSAWHQAGDEYGSKVDYACGTVGHRTGSMQEGVQGEAVAHAMGDRPKIGNRRDWEVLVGDKINLWKWATKLKISRALKHKPGGGTRTPGEIVAARQEFIDKLKARGITHAGPKNIPIEQVIE